MNFSFWETDSWFSDIDYCIVGSGITGLNCALRIKQQQPNSKVIMLEKGMLPEGASTKNAGFACFGSISEILDDLNTHSKHEVVRLVEKRKKGLELLRNNLGDEIIDYQQNGGYELFTEADEELYKQCLERIPEVNEILKPVFDKEVFEKSRNKFGFKKIQQDLIFNKFEGQIDTGKMMTALVKKAITKEIRILNGVEVESFEEIGSRISITTNKFNFQSKKLIIATNGFASRLGIEQVKPARAQVLVTKPIKDIPFKGTFHLDKGYYYFRNIGNRVLFGGGRNLDFETEETDKSGLTGIIQNRLKELLKTCVLPEIDFEIQQSWSGIMGVGDQKKPIIREISNNIYCGVRLGGMGIAIGSMVGKELADLALKS
ncbi:NAD(P)/FAD-dependent oxidoreductase [Christiangramia forsetii]|uniref:FAD-dependent oxidoreductase n=2 Tax=Christiangramia forsetii TaxID=411153 RepID=A0M6P2_CHRFK|nr:FAD-dependent oxidoreductase [Christiangramia forsetii]GGG29925.1 FAD-dependent oxidoreductase [Christiangramia forsetii]CAL68287.1 FAD-dependent oxidoreductase [Christiangramia forsetii KT0803]